MLSQDPNVTSGANNRPKNCINKICKLKTWLFLRPLPMTKGVFCCLICNSNQFLSKLHRYFFRDLKSFVCTVLKNFCFFAMSAVSCQLCFFSYISCQLSFLSSLHTCPNFYKTLRNQNAVVNLDS